MGWRDCPLSLPQWGYRFWTAQTSWKRVRELRSCTIILLMCGTKFEMTWWIISVLQFRVFCWCVGWWCGTRGPFRIAGCPLGCLDRLVWGCSTWGGSVAWTGRPWSLFTLRAPSLRLPRGCRLGWGCGVYGRLDFRRQQKTVVQRQGWQLGTCSLKEFT